MNKENGHTINYRCSEMVGSSYATNEDLRVTVKLFLLMWYGNRIGDQYALKQIKKNMNKL